MATYTRQLQAIVDDYRAAGEPWPAAARAIAAWAIRTGRWRMPESAIISKCAEDLAKAMREEHTTDASGRRVRMKHPVTLRQDGEQMVLWDDMRTAPREHMALSFQQRRRQIVDDCRQLKADIAGYNASHPDEEPIQMAFDFTRDLAELEAAPA